VDKMGTHNVKFPAENITTTNDLMGEQVNKRTRG